MGKMRLLKYGIGLKRSTYTEKTKSFIKYLFTRNVPIFVQIPPVAPKRGRFSASNVHFRSNYVAQKKSNLVLQYRKRQNHIQKSTRMSISKKLATSDFNALCAEANRRVNELSDNQKLPSLSDRDEEKCSSCPIIDTFLELGGAEGIIKLTNFTATEIKNVFEEVVRYLITNMSTCRGKKSKVSLLNNVFIVRTVIRNVRKWELLAAMFF